MDTIWSFLLAALIEGICATKIARKFDSHTPAWKFFIPIYNILLYGQFSLLSARYLTVLAITQAADLLLLSGKELFPAIASFHPVVSYTGFLLWAIMMAQIAVRLGLGFWSYLSATLVSTVASNFVVIALLYVFVPAFELSTSAIPLWAELVAILIMSLPFISLAFDKNVQRTV